MIVLLLAVGAGALYAWRSRHAAAPAAGIEALEARLAKGADLTLDEWLSYGDAMAARGKHEQAALGYRGALGKEAGNRRAQLGLTVNLAQGQKTDELLALLREMCSAEAKLVLELLDRKELAAFKADKRFKDLEEQARAEAMD